MEGQQMILTSMNTSSVDALLAKPISVAQNVNGLALAMSWSKADGVWDLMGLHQAIRKMGKARQDGGTFGFRCDFYLRKVGEAKRAYKREASAWEIRAKRYGEVENGQRSE